MKEFKIYVPSRKEAILEELFEEFLLTRQKLVSDDEMILYILRVENDKSNSLLHELKIRGIGDVYGDITIVPISTFISSQHKEDRIPPSSGANIEEILSVLEESSVVNSNYISLVILSSILAAFGLVDNNIVIIIGSMIVAPLMGPIALTSLGSITPGRGFLKRGLIAEVLGIGITILVGFIVGISENIGRVGGIPISEEMIARTVLNDTVIIFSLVSGIAAGLIIAKGSNISIVGVAIAASLAPPAATIGLYLAAGHTVNVIESSLLLSLNILSINLACSIIFLLYKLPQKAGSSKRQSDRASRTSRILIFLVGILFVIVAVLSIYLPNIFSK